jgi:hypothetical protein
METIELASGETLVQSALGFLTWHEVCEARHRVRLKRSIRRMGFTSECLNSMETKFLLELKQKLTQLKELSGGLQ